MGALETYPPVEGEALHFEDNNYAHAVRFLESLEQRDFEREKIKIGTISKVEWEAIKLYLAFSFRKD